MLCPPFAYISYSSFSTHSFIPPFGALILSLFPLFFYPSQNFSRIPLLLSPSTSPTVLNFYLDSRWGLHADRLVVSKEQRCARSVPGLSLLQAADRALTSCHLTADLLVGDVAITQGRHYWACSVEPGSYLVKASSAAKENILTVFPVPPSVSLFPFFSLSFSVFNSSLYILQVGVGLESKLQEWFHLPQDMASPR